MCVCQEHTLCMCVCALRKLHGYEFIYKVKVEQQQRKQQLYGFKRGMGIKMG